MPVAATSATVTTQDAVKPPSSVVTVMVAVPALMPLTVPLFTVATLASLVDQLMFLLVALLGDTVAVRVVFAPVSRLALVLFKDTPVTEIGLTWTSQVAVKPPSSVVTVMVVSPGFNAVTTPSLTVATASLLEDQVTFLFVASFGETVATKVIEPLSRIVAEVLSNETPVTFVMASAS